MERMELAVQISVIVLAATAFILVMLGVVVMVVLLKLVKRVRLLADKAEGVVENAQEVTTILKNASGPLALFKIIANMQRYARKGRK
jgi:hypothetical protein